jgi:hypothetical protein
MGFRLKRALIPTVSILFVLLLSTLVNFGPTVQPAKAQDQPSGSFSDDFSTNTGSWQYFGCAYRDTTNQNLVLTPSGNQQAGVAFFTAPIPGAFTASFRFKAGGGYQGDGFTMFFYKQKYSAVDSSDSGCRLGFNSISVIPGYGIEFDGWQNVAWDFQGITGGQQNPQGDPSGSHVALIQDYTGNHLTYVNDTRVADDNWHQATVEVQGASVSVSVDQGQVLKWSGTLNRTYDGFGFSGATGGCGSNYHIIDDFSITARNLQTPTLKTTCISSASQGSFNVYKINGNLTFNGVAVTGKPISLSYSVTGGDSWQDLSLVYTGSDGSYSALWMPTVTGNYLLKAVYKGDENYLGTNNQVSFAIEPALEQSVFSLTSNSTITALTFDSASKELSFSVSGPAGTAGYVNVCIPKSMVNDSSGLKVYLDGNQLEYKAQSQGENWLLYFTYHHSTHSVMISLGSSTELNGVVSVSPGNWATIGVVLVAITAIAIVEVLVLRKSSQKT